MKTNVVSGWVRHLSKELFVMLACAVLGSAGCSDPVPSCNGCVPPSNPTPFKAGDLPGSAASLNSGRCGATGSELMVLNDAILATDLAAHSVSSSTFSANQPFVIYWSICNVGAGKSPAVSSSPPLGLQISARGGSYGQSFAYSVPALDSCQCVVPQQQLPMGLTTPDIYDVNLVGQFKASTTFTIN
jgi:hypothetical protein